MRHPPLHTDVPGSGALDQCAAATVRGWRRAKPIHVSTPGITIPTHLLRHPNTTNTLAHYYQPLQTERADGIKMVRRRQRRGNRLHLPPLRKRIQNISKLSKLFFEKRILNETPLSNRRKSLLPNGGYLNPNQGTL